MNQLRQHGAHELAAGYSRKIRALEVGSVLSFFALVGMGCVRMWRPSLNAPWLALSALLCGFLMADFVSGFVHWSADTWGSVDMPWIGKALIRPFREHHVDQVAITRHDFIETNGNNCLISLPVGMICLFLNLQSSSGLFASIFLTSMIVFVFLTNQFHKWAHTANPAPVVAFLQRMHLILPPAHHAIHHAAPFNKYYCITVGWLNWPLHKLRFFRAAEWLVTSVAGLLPRQDDIGEVAARMIAPVVVEPSREADSATSGHHA